MSVAPSTLPSVLPSTWAQLQPQEADFVPMVANDLSDVMAIERVAYTWPWSEGNIVDSIVQGHRCMRLERYSESLGGTQLLGYTIAMPGVQEVHLLNITVAPAYQRQGWARVMLDELVDWSRAQRMQWLWLEVRQSNDRAREIYERYGFRHVSVRKGYYPLDGTQREDALVMNLALDAR